MGGQIRISAKNLGELALPESCPRCFWIKLRVRNRLPWQIFPGIFSSIDTYSKRLVQAWFDHKREAPPWLAGLGEISGYRQPPHYSQFNIVDAETNILLTGTPDGVFVRRDKSHVIVDYKTAKYTEKQDELYPMYEVQLNVYARIGNERGLKPVTGLALLYTEPLTDDHAAATGKNRLPDGFSMKFVAKMLEVPIKRKMLEPLLAKTRQLYERSSAPPGRRGCEDCERLSELVAAVTK